MCCSIQVALNDRLAHKTAPSSHTLELEKTISGNKDNYPSPSALTCNPFVGSNNLLSAACPRSSAALRPICNPLVVPIG